MLLSYQKQMFNKINIIFYFFGALHIFLLNSTKDGKRNHADFQFFSFFCFLPEITVLRSIEPETKKKLLQKWWLYLWAGKLERVEEKSHEVLGFRYFNSLPSCETKVHYVSFTSFLFFRFFLRKSLQWLPFKLDSFNFQENTLH